LQVLKDFGAATTNSIVASICPKLPGRTDQERGEPDYGYNPAVNAIVDRLKEAFTGKCLSRQLNVKKDANGNPVVPPVIPCKIVEVTRVEGQACGGSGEPQGGCDPKQGRGSVSTQLQSAVREQLRTNAKNCGAEGQPKCEDFCMCTINALTNRDDVNLCQTADKDSALQSIATPGYCYVDPLPPPAGQGIGKVEAIQAGNCKETEPRRLRFAGKDTPVNGSITFIACLGEVDTNATIDASTNATIDASTNATIDASTND
jgi:hypothetical protein